MAGNSARRGSARTFDEIHEGARADVAAVHAYQLTYEQMMYGVPCPGCGRPLLGEAKHLCAMELDVLVAIEQGARDVRDMVSVRKPKLFEEHLRNLTSLRLVRVVDGVADITDAGREELALSRADVAWQDEHKQACTARVGGRFGLEGGPTHCAGCCPLPPRSAEHEARLAAAIEHVFCAP